MNNLHIQFPILGEQINNLNNSVSYSVGRLINQGGFGILYEGLDSYLNEIAIKVLQPNNRPFNEVLNEWQKECSFLFQIRHPNIVYMYDAFNYKNLFYIVFEKANGNLFDLIKNHRNLSQIETFDMARQLLFALNYIHNSKIIHKDLTVYNVLYFKENDSSRLKYKISDFGISESFYFNNNNFVHPAFATPELLNFGYSNFQSDLYHLGIILYFCLTGYFPYDINTSHEVIKNSILSGIPRQKAEALDCDLGNFISVLLRRHQEYRFRSANDAWIELSKIINKLK